MSAREIDIRVTGPLLTLAGITVVAAVARTVGAGGEAGGWSSDLILLSLVFGAFVALGEVLRLTLPGGRQSAPLAAAGALAFALLPTFKDVPMPDGVEWYLAITVVTLGSVVGAFPRALTGRAMHLDELARRVLATLVASLVFHGLVADTGSLTDKRLIAIAMTVAAAAAATADALLAATVRAGAQYVPLRIAVIDEGRALVGIQTAIAATGVLMALSGPSMGYWALPIFAVPLLLTQFSFRRYATIDATYDQTIKALSKVTEVGGYTETGHSDRVTRLAETVGREMGLTQRQLKDLQYAARMHDIGQLSLSDPIPGGATTFLSAVDQRQIAELGAGIIRQAGVLDAVAAMVERQSDPYRPARGYVDSELPLESRIIKVANAYDDLVGASVESDRMQQALERLSLGTDREYDPQVVDALAAIIERRLELAYLR